MFSTFVKNLAKGLVALGILASALPLSTFAADAAPDIGKITINVTDERGAKFSGNWYLYKGLVQYGWVVRNGTSGEVFDFPPSTYFLEARAIPSDHPFHLIRSDNPQTLDIGGSIVFNVQYFKTEEQFLNAKNGLTAPAPAAPTTPTPSVDPTPAVQPAPTASTPTTDQSTRTPLSAEEGSTPAYLYDSSSWAETSATSASAPEYQLAATGPAEAIPLIAIFSVLVGALSSRKKRSR